MLVGYVFATVLGGILLIASVATGHHDTTHDAGHDTGHEAASVATLVFSLRFWTYLLAFGGLTGLVVKLVAGGGDLLAGLLAGGVGLASGATAQVVVNRLASQGGGTVRADELVGRTGRLLLPAGPGKSGRVRLEIRNATVDLIATADEPELGANDEVLVIDVKDGVAHVTRNPTKREG